MKLCTFVAILMACNFALAESAEDLGKRGCIPRRDITTGEISGYDCNVTQNSHEKMAMQNLEDAKKVEMKNISSSDMQIHNQLKTTNEYETAIGEVKNLNDIISKKDLAAQTNLSALLAQIKLKQVKDPKTGKSLFQVTKIEKGSVWEKSGLKVGELVKQ